MKKFKFHYLLPLLCLGMLITSCDDDEPDVAENTITITIEEPLTDEVISADDCGEVHIHIKIVASDENHEVEVVLHPEGDVNDKILDFHDHEHDADIDFEQEVNLCAYPSGTCFHLEVEACIDHDCEMKERADVEFCLE